MSKMSLKKFYCAISKCNIENANLERRHFFKFPKEHDRWLQWVKACGRVDLEAKGPQYANQNCYLCNLHFEDKWYKTNNIRARLHPDAIPTKFYTSSLNQNDAVDISSSMEKETATTIQETETTKKKAKQQNNEEIQEQVQRIETDTQQEKRNENTSSTSNKSSIELTENSPRKRKLRMKIMKLKAQNKTLRETIRRMKRKKQTKIAPKKEEDEHETLRELGCKLLPTNFARLLSVQIDKQIKSKRGIRYDPEFKKFALSIYFSSPRSYRQLKESIALPSVRSLHLFTNTWNIVPGINNKVFDALAIKMNSLPLIERYCILCADEMSLKSHLFYNVSRDEIIGFEDTGNNKSFIPAKNVLVLMARSIAGNWKIPVCYCFVETACLSKIVKDLIFEIIMKLKNSGAMVLAFVTDMGSNFMQLSRELGISTENSIFSVQEEKIVYFFDTPHLIKALRNMLLLYNFIFNNKIASWNDIVEFYKRDSKQWMKTAPKLTHCHIQPNNFLKMKVKFAVQIFSHCVAAGMCTQMSSGFLPSKAVGTIDLIDHFDKLFDMLNSSSLNTPKEHAKVFTGSKKQIEFLEEMSYFIKSIKVVKENGSNVKVKCLDCWQITIKSTIELWKILKNLNFPYLRTRRLNQDCLENFFGSVRQQGGNSVNPTPIQFSRAFKKLFNSRYFKHSDTQNCAEDKDEMLNILQAYNINNVESISEFVPSPTNKVILDIPIHDYRSMDLPEENAFKYVCGYLIKKCTEIHSCDVCIKYVNENKTVLDDSTLYCSFRAYNNEASDFGNLNIPSNNFCLFIHQLEEIFVKNFENNCFQKGIGDYLLKLAQNVTFESPCPNFPTTFLIKLFFRMRIYYTLSQHNKACKGI